MLEYFIKCLQLTILEFFVLVIMVTFLFQSYVGGRCQKCQPKKSQERPCDSMAGTGGEAVSTDVPREGGGEAPVLGLNWGIRP